MLAAEHEIIWQPNPGPQKLAITCPAEIILFGGAVGGGKSDWLLADAAAHGQRYGKHASMVLFRRSYPELEELIMRSHALFIPVGAVYKAQSTTWTFPSGAVLRLRHLERDSDWTKYQGHQYTWVAFDEAGLYPQTYPIEMIRGRMRSAAGVPVRLLFTANPGGPGHGWLKEWFMIDPKTGQKREPFKPFFCQVRNAYMCFIPSKLADNPQLMANDPNYATRIGGPAWLRHALVEGDWDVMPEGGILDPGLFVRDMPPKAMRFYAGIDMAVSPLPTADFSAIAVWGVARMGKELHYWLVHADEWRSDTEASADRILDVLDRWKPACTWMEGGPTGKGFLPWLRRKMREEGRHHPVLLCSHAGADKIAKAASMQAALNAQCCHLEPDSPFWYMVRDRFVVFSGERDGIDDLVDAAGIPLRFAPALIGQSQPLPETPSVPRSSVGMRQRNEAIARTIGKGHTRHLAKKLF